MNKSQISQPTEQISRTRRRGFDRARAFLLLVFVALALVSLVAQPAAHAQSDTLKQASRAYQNKDYKESLRLIEEAEQQDNNDPFVYQAKGATLRRLGDNDGARQAWEKLLQIDPNLNSVKNKRSLLEAFQAVGGQVPQRGNDGNAQDNGSPEQQNNGSTGANEVIVALTNGNSYVDPSLQGQADAARIESAASSTKKIVVTPTVAPYQNPQQYASELRKALNLGEGVVIVVTPRRVGASSGRISTNQVNNSLKNANLNQAYARGGLTEAAVVAATAVEGSVRNDRNTDNGIGTVLALGVGGGIFGFIAFRNHKHKKAMEEARAPLEVTRRKVLDAISYVDGYLDVLPAGDAREDARRLRAEGVSTFEGAVSLAQRAKNPDDLRQPRVLLEDADRKLTECRRQIDLATGGTGVVAEVPEMFPSLLQTDDQKAQSALRRAEEIQSKDEAANYQRQIDQIPADQRGVSFFSGRPLPANELVPVTIVVDGRRQTVMAARDEANEIKAGRMPQVRAFDDGNGRYVPWYEHRGYDPYRDYYGGWGYSPIGTFVDFYIMTSLLGGGLFGGYGGWGYPGYGWGYPPVLINSWGYDGYPPAYGVGHYDGGSYGGGYADQSPMQTPVVPENSGGFEFFGQQGYDDTGAQGGGGFGGGDSGGGMFDFGGGGSSDGGSWDSGGGDFGGGDFGGGDGGGGGD